MGQRDDNERMAREYLHANASLRAAVGADEGDVLEPHYLGVGEHNLNYWFVVPATGEKHVLRINVATQPFHENQVAYEYGALKALEPSGCTPRAMYLDDSADAPAKGALVIEFCDGEELDFDALRPGDLRCAAQLMADIHAVPVTADCPVFRPKDPLRNLFDECLERFRVYRASAFEDARITKWVESFIAAAEPATRMACDLADCTHIINTETLPSHFLIPAAAAAEAATAPDAVAAPDVPEVRKTAVMPTATAAAGALDAGVVPGKVAASGVPKAGSGRFCAHPGSFVDWERPIIGEVAQDVAYFVSPTTTFWDSDYLFPADEVGDFVEDYWRAVDGRFARGNFDERFKAFRMMTALRSATWFCKALLTYGKDGRGTAASSDSSHTTSKTARKFATYLSDDFMHMLAVECFGL